MLGIGSKRIGITIDHTGVRYVTVKKRKTWEIAGSGFLEIPEGIIVDDQIANEESLSLQLKDWVKKEKLKGASATISIPTSQIIIRKMRIPSIKAHELRQLVELEVETALRLPFEDPVYDFIKVSHDDESTLVLVFAAPKKLISSYVKVLEDSGIHVKSAEISATALARAIAAQQEEYFTETMLISQDPTSIEVYMFQNGNPIFMRTVTLYDQGERQDGELTPDQIAEVTAEISRMLSFYQYSIQEGASRISNIVVTGTSAGRVQLHRELQQALAELDVQTVGFGVFSKDQASSFSADDFRVAVGLSMFSKQNSRINLLPTTKTETKVRALIAGLLIILWIAGLAITTIMYMANRSTIADNASQVSNMNTQKTALEAKLLKKPQNKSTPEAFIQAMMDARQQSVDMIGSIRKPLPVDAQITTLTYAGGSQITLTVVLASMEDASRYLYDLRQLPFAEKTTLHSITESGGQVTSSTSPEGETTVTTGTKQYTVNFTVTLKKSDNADSSAKPKTEAAEGGNADVQTK